MKITEVKAGKFSIECSMDELLGLEYLMQTSKERQYEFMEMQKDAGEKFLQQVYGPHIEQADEFIQCAREARKM